MFTTAFIKGLAERAVKTFCQVLVGYIAVGTTGLLDLDWVSALSISGAATLASVLTSIGNADFTAGVSRDPEAVATVADIPVDEIDDPVDDDVEATETEADREPAARHLAS